MATGDKIKGLTVKIGADTSDFNKALKDVNKEINTTQKSVSALQQGLKLEFDEKKFAQAQRKAQQALTETEQKAEAIRKQLKFLEESGGIDTTDYATLQAELDKSETQALKLKKQLEDINSLKFKDVHSKLEDVGKTLDTLATKTKALSIASAGALAGATALAKGAVETGDTIQTTADQYNMSAEAIQRWNYIALQSDVSADILFKAMTKTRDAVGTALTGGTSTGTKALEALVGDLNRLPTDTEEAFNYIVSALAGVGDSTLQAYYANEIFGERMAVQLIPLINQGADGLAELAEEFEQVGYLTNDQVRGLADFDNELNKVNTQLAVSKTELGIAMIPLLETINDLLISFLIPAMKSVAEWFGGLSEGGQKFVIALVAMLAVLSPTLKLMSSMVTTVPKLIKYFKDLDKQVLITRAGFVAFAGALALGVNLIADWKKMSTVEKILKSLALAALVAAGAITVFHASWSLGLAIGAITAGVVAGIATIKSATEDLGLDETAIDDSGVGAGSTGYGYNPSTYGSSGAHNTYNEDNSQYSISINLNSSGNLDYDARSLATEVIKQIQIQKQAGGR